MTRTEKTVLYAIGYGQSERKAFEGFKKSTPRMPARLRKAKFKRILFIASIK